jgi:hypothetical protein
MEWHTSGSAAHDGVSTVLNHRLLRVGSVTRAGRVFNLAHELLGTIVRDGRIRLPGGMVVGQPAVTGEVMDLHGTVLARVLSTGSGMDGRDRYLGRVNLTPEVSLQLAAGATLLLLPVEGVSGTD